VESALARLLPKVSEQARGGVEAIRFFPFMEKNSGTYTIYRMILICFLLENLPFIDEISHLSYIDTDIFDGETIRFLRDLSCRQFHRG